MIVIGMVGGVASGKSLVTEQFESLGAVVIGVDEIGHQVLREKHIKQLIHERWGRRVFDTRGEVDRSRLGEIVFDPASAGELKKLEEITHPEIESRIKDRLEQLRSDEQVKVVIVDAPIMIKTGWYRLCEEMVFVEAALEKRIARAQARGWTAEMLRRREKAQATIDEKRSLCSFQIDNNGTPSETFEQTREFWSRLTDQRFQRSPT